MQVLSGIAALAVIYLTSLYSFPLFQITVELISITICISMFFVAWNSRNYTDNKYFTFLGIAFFFVGIIEFLHTMTFDSMPLSASYDTNVQTQLWIAARYVQSISLVLAIVFIRRKLLPGLVIAAYTVCIGAIMLSIFIWPVFPVAYVPGQGLTLFKISSEFIICSTLTIAGGLLWICRSSFDRAVLINILMSIAFGIMAEMAFMLYKDTTNIFYLLGHLFYIVSFYLIYRAIVVTGLQQPYNILYRNIAVSRDLIQKERDKLDNILDLEESIMLALDTNGKVTLINRKGHEILGMDEKEIIGKPWFETFVPERIRQESINYFNNFVKGQAGLDKYHNNPILTSRGEERQIEWHNELLKDEAGKIIGSFSSGQDITERKQAEALFQAIFNTSPIGMYVAQDRKFKLVNPQFLEYLGYTEEELIGRDPISLVEPEERDNVRKNAVKALKSPKGHFFTYDYKVMTHSGKPTWFLESLTSISYNGRRATLGIIVDISERKKAEELFKSLSLVDDLTGLYNRRGFLTLANKQLKLSNRMKQGVSVLFADVNKMKWINDNLGHVEGDSALISIAKILKETFRESDIVARIHGDEFAVFMSGSDETYSETIKKRLEERLKEFNLVSKKPYELSLSIGISSAVEGKPANLNELLEQADKLMYERKRQGR